MTTQPNPDPTNKDSEQLEEIMEDLITGHNFEYAKQALQAMLVEARVDELNLALDSRVPRKHHGTGQIPVWYVKDRLFELKGSKNVQPN